MEVNYESMTVVAEQNTEGETSTILLIDDDPNMRMHLQHVLGEQYSYLEAGEAEEGLRMARTRDPDLVISDVIMPGADGFQLLKCMREDPACEQLPVLMLTVCTEHESKIRGLDGAANDYLTKPFDPDELQLRIRNLLRFSRFTMQRHNSEQGNRKPTFKQRLESVVSRCYTMPTLQVADIASKLSMSERKLQRMVRDELEMSPSNYLFRYRLEQSKRLLANSELMIAEIAENCGFSSASHYAQRFKKEYQITPGNYKKLG